MPRPCSYCNRLASLETEAELAGDPEVQEDGTVTASVRLVRNSACCGDQMKEYNAELEGAIEAGADCTDTEGHRWEWDFESEEPEVTERYQTHDKRGKPIKRMRYQRSYIGATLEVGAICSVCGATGSCTLTDEAQASWFDEL